MPPVSQNDPARRGLAAKRSERMGGVASR